MMMAARKPPFALSGTFASDLEGWVGSASWTSSNTRTSPGAADVFNGYAEFLVPAAFCAGQRISASIWHRYGTGSGNRSFSSKIGAGSWITIGASTATSGGYAQFSGSFSNPGNNDVTLRFESSGRAYWDDWAILGV